MGVGVYEAWAYHQTSGVYYLVPILQLFVAHPLNTLVFNTEVSFEPRVPCPVNDATILDDYIKSQLYFTINMLLLSSLYL
jgi:hypothetical protein